MGAYAVSRSTTVVADPARVHGLINDFHEWTAWSPWEDIDPDLKRDYTGPDQGVGARYAWSGNRKAGEGSMEITSRSLRRASRSRICRPVVPASPSMKTVWAMRSSPGIGQRKRALRFPEAP